METLLDLKENRKLLEQIVEHGTRVDGVLYKISDVVVEKKYQPNGTGNLFMHYGARIGEHYCSGRTDEKSALHALIGVLGSMRSYNERVEIEGQIKDIIED